MAINEVSKHSYGWSDHIIIVRQFNNTYNRVPESIGGEFIWNMNSEDAVCITELHCAYYYACKYTLGVDTN